MAANTRTPPYLTDDPAYWRRFGIEGNSMPDTSHLITDDGKPVDNLYVEREYSLLIGALYTSYKPPQGRNFYAASDVGLFHDFKKPPIVPDVMLSLDVPEEAGKRRDPNFRSYFAWMMGKMPDVVIEIVSDRRAREDTRKKAKYANLQIPYYVIHDPLHKLSEETLTTFEFRNGQYEVLDSGWFEKIGIGVTLWYGTYLEMEAEWLRWCDRDGIVLPTASEANLMSEERAFDEEARANRERDNAKRERDNANRERDNAKREKANAERAQLERDLARAAADAKELENRAMQDKVRLTEEKMRLLTEKLKSLGVDPDV